MNVLTRLLATAAFMPALVFSHPADSNADNQITDAELLAYAVGSTDASLRQQAENIWKHGGAYESNSATGTTVYLPLANSADFVPINRYTVAPFDSVAIALPAPAKDLVAHYHVSADRSKYFTAAITEVEGEVFLGFPPHPATPETGGTVYLELTEAYGTAAETVHPVGFVAIEARASGRPGSFNGLVSAMNATISHLENMREIDYSSYFVGGPNYSGPFVDDAEALEVALVRLLQDPNMPGGLQPVLALTSGDDAYSIAFRDSLDDFYDYGPLTDVAELLPTQLSGPNAASARLMRSARSAGGGGRVFAYKPDISNDAQLAALMGEQWVAEQMLQDPVFSPDAGAANMYVGLAGPPGAVASSVYGTASSLLQLVYERRANTYPHRAELSASFSKAEFKQDECGVIGSWEASATATSKGWNASSAVIDLTLNFAGSMDAAADGIKFAQSTGQASVEFSEALIAEAAKTNLNKVRDDSLKGLGGKSELITIPPESWTVLNMGPSYVEMKQTGSMLTVDGINYYPNAIGSSNAFLSVIDGLFPSGRVTASDPQLITLTEAQLTLSGQPPATYTPGQTYTITATPSNLSASAPSISWAATGGDLGTAVDLGGGQSQVNWTAPDPAEASAITITANLDDILCHPPDAPTLTTATVTGGGRYELTVSPLKSCYDPGEVINLTFVDLDDPTNDPLTNFELTGPGMLSPTGNNTATVTYDNAGSVGIIASLTGEPGNFDTAEFVYGCVDLEPAIVAYDDEIDTMTLTIGDELNLFLYGTIETTNDTLSIAFTARTHYDYQFADYQERLAEYNAAPSGNPPEPPIMGQIGTYITTGAAYVDPSFALEVTMPYTTESCGPAIPGSIQVCYIEADSEETNVVTVGIDGDYTVDTTLAANSIRFDVPGSTTTTFTVYLVPEN